VTTTTAPFDPAANGTLTDLGTRLRDLAGDSAYRAGRDYLRKGKVRDGAVAGSQAYATVSGSTDYRVTLAFPSVEATRVTCSCPAHRRSKYCKHVVAVCTALLEQPATFAVLDEIPAPPTPKKTARARASEKAPRVDPSAQRASGLEVVDRLLTELADGGLVQLGPEKVSLIAQAAELVRALKLRRLGNLLMQLQRIVADRRAIDEAGFARLLVELYLCRAATGAQLAGTVALDPRLADDLLGKIWRAEELEPIGGLDLIEVAFSHQSDGEFVLDTSYLVDLASHETFAEIQITPLRLRSAANTAPHHRMRLLVDEAGLYPGLAPRRIRLSRTRREALRTEDIDRLVAGAVADLAEVRRRLVERAAVPFGQPEVAVLFRPATVLASPEGGLAPDRPAGAVDADGRFLSIEWGEPWASQPAGVLSTVLARAQADGSPIALFGLVSLAEQGLVLRCLSLVGASVRGQFGRILPEPRPGR
jgi:hypothetical protein